jgi:hypothetical protein
MSIVGGSKRTSKDPGKEVFKISRTDTSSPEEWVREVEQCASKLRGEKTRFRSLEQTASILIDDFDHVDLKKYPGSGMEKPPCSIAQAANGGPLNCVGRIATLVTIAEDRNMAKDLYRHVVIGVNVNWKGLGANKRVEGGHIYGYIRGKGGDKTYLGKPQDLTSTETYEIDMLPAFYKVNLALAIGLEGNEKQAKVLAVEAQEDATKESMYLNYLANKIKNY